jgi:UDP-N-acetylmuramate: L-alanyl-gamma-D-glutamyl-meso-diaminopimelate ligase
VDRAVEALGRFGGVRRRQELVGEAGGVTIIDDFAHHPTAVHETLKGIRARYPSRRLIAVFEPRTNTSVRALFQMDYVSAFLEADMTVACEPRAKDLSKENASLSAARIAVDLARLGREAYAFSCADEILEFLSQALQSRDVVLIMSTGAFDDLPNRLQAILRRRDL